MSQDAPSKLLQFALWCWYEERFGAAVGHYTPDGYPGGSFGAVDQTEKYVRSWYSTRVTETLDQSLPRIFAKYSAPAILARYITAGDLAGLVSPQIPGTPDERRAEFRNFAVWIIDRVRQRLEADSWAPNQSFFEEV
jgi:hypothetical protein